MRRRAFLVTVAAAAAALAVGAADPVWARGDGQDEGQGGKGRGKDGEKGAGKDGEKGGKGGEKPGEKPGEKAGEKGETPPKAKDPKDAPEWKECEAIGAEFAAKKSKSLVARLRPAGKLDVKLGEKATGRYAADQAAEVLDKWFLSKVALTVKLRSVKDLVASFDLTVRRAGTDRENSHQLLVEIRKREKGGGFHLVRLEKLEKV